MDVIGKARGTILKHQMLRRGDSVLIGLSGGADSVCLLKVLHSLKDEFGLTLYSTYIDHGLRPKDTPGETDFARRFSEDHGVPFFAEKADVASYAREARVGKQEAARTLRYRIYEDLMNRLGASRTALGHTADDQVETFFMRLLRGAGPAGLCSIPPVRGRFIRPLIEIARKDIEAYLAEQGTDFITDPSNLKLDYTRNRVRHRLMPVLKGFNPNLEATVLRTISILNEEERYFDSIVLKTLMRLIPKKTDQEIELFIVPLETMDKVILRRVLRKAVGLTKGLATLGFGHIEDIIGLVREGRAGDRITLPGGIRAVKKYSTLLITSAPPVRIGTYRLDCPGSVRIEETGAVISTSVVGREEAIPPEGRRIAVLDREKVRLPLSVRARKDGDFFYPEGFGRRRKLQDFFVDLKIPRDERDSVPVVVDAEGEIVWVAGMRADERFSASQKTKEFMVIELKS